MKRRILLVGLAAGVVAVPAAIAAKPATTPATPTHPAVAAHAPVVSYLFKGKIESVDQTAKSAVINPVKGTNIFARRALGTATTMTLNLDGTVLRLRSVAGDGAKTFTPETIADLKPGDIVFFHIRAKKRTPLAELPAAKWLRDLSPNPVTI